MPSWLLNQVALPAQRIVADALSDVGARRPHYAVLAAVEEFGPASQAALGRRCGIDRSDMVALVNELSAAGRLERTPDPDDRRRNVVAITDAGRAFLSGLDRLLRDAQDELLAPLSPRERAELTRLLDAVLAHHSG
jgi:MarR family transcriptional regulator, lower aerobic nicotinate degradation pathway regulator